MKNNKEFKEEFTTFNMKKEDKYFQLLLWGSLLFVLSFFSLLSNDTATNISSGIKLALFYIIFVLLMIIVIFKKWVKKKILKNQFIKCYFLKVVRRLYKERLSIFFMTNKGVVYSL